MQLVDHVAVHPVVAAPRLGGGIEVEPRADAEVPVLVLAGEAGAARAGVRRHQHHAVLGGQALRAGLDHEGFLGAGQPGQVEQHRHRAVRGLGRHEDRKAHGQADLLRGMAIVALPAIEAAMLRYEFQDRHVSTPRRSGWTRRASSGRSLR
ncbi:Uncharacterised protein [Bordetella pertussis]|nr:Uncharacterised protein [Bordetella pertussis]